MEVHAHAHTPRKKWAHYFWEFLMLFLAVFCGFLAEYQLEQTIEQHREKDYMKSMVRDLQADIRGINAAIKLKFMKIDLADSLLTLFEKKDFKNTSGSIYNIGGELSLRSYFNPNDGTVQQLKNAGGLRLIKKVNVVDSIEHYWNLMRDLQRLQDLEESELVEYHSEISKIFSARVINQMLPSKQTMEINKLDTNPELMSEDDQHINDLDMKIVIAKGNRLYQVQTLNELKQSAETLIVLIEKEYHLQ
ncbi:MAG TPA: hypothetical protein VFU29_19230 [Chitinophagaceae bacterium]|nr:hypothetical protein [Chitinophagaceae bacterium]